MPLRCDEYNHVSVLALDGDLVGDQVAAARKLFDDRLERRQAVSYVIDFEKCGYVDSAGLELLLWLRRRCEDLFGQVKLAGIDENVRKILEITRLAQRFECHADVAFALRTM